MHSANRLESGIVPFLLLWYRHFCIFHFVRTTICFRTMGAGGTGTPPLMPERCTEQSLVVLFSAAYACFLQVAFMFGTALRWLGGTLTNTAGDMTSRSGVASLRVYFQAEQTLGIIAL